jgi:hypothetical protein
MQSKPLFIKFAVVVAVCAVFWYEWLVISKKPWPECDSQDSQDFSTQLNGYLHGDTATLTAQRKELKGECVFSKDYAGARSLFLRNAIELRGGNHEATVSGFTYDSFSDGDNLSGTKLVTDYMILRGSKKKFVISFSGCHGPEGFAGSAVQNAVLMHLQSDKELLNRYTEAAVLRDTHRVDDTSEVVPIDEMRLPPTVVVVHAVNPFGMANNRRVNEDNVDINRNYLEKELFDMATARDPNHAGYLDMDFMLNPQSQPSSLTLVNDVWGHLKSAFALARFGMETIKRGLLAGNYFRQSGLGYGGVEQTASVRNMIKLADIVGLGEAEQVTLVDLHTGLGPSGTDTLATLSPGDKAGGQNQFKNHVDKVFPIETDPSEPKWQSGMKAVNSDTVKQKEGTAMSGYDLTIGIVDNYCNKYLAPHLSKSNKLLCVTQEFGTVDTITVGKALVDENYAWHHGSKAEKELYGERLKAAFFIQDRAWMRSVVHRGLSVFKQAFAATD